MTTGYRDAINYRAAINYDGATAGTETGTAANTFGMIVSAAVGVCNGTRTGTAADTFPMVVSAAVGVATGQTQTGTAADTFPMIVSAAVGVCNGTRTGTSTATFPMIVSAAVGVAPSALRLIVGYGGGERPKHKKLPRNRPWYEIDLTRPEAPAPEPVETAPEYTAPKVDYLTDLTKGMEAKLAAEVKVRATRADREAIARIQEEHRRKEVADRIELRIRQEREERETAQLQEEQKRYEAKQERWRQIAQDDEDVMRIIDMIESGEFANT